MPSKLASEQTSEQILEKIEALTIKVDRIQDSIDKKTESKEEIAARLEKLKNDPEHACLFIPAHEQPLPPIVLLVLATFIMLGAIFMPLYIAAPCVFITMGFIIQPLIQPLILPTLRKVFK